VVAGDGGGGYADGSYFGGGNSGGNISFSNSTCNYWIYAGNGGDSLNINYYSGNGGNIIVTNSSIPNGIYGGFAGASTGGDQYGNYNADYYLSSGTFGYVEVDGGSQTFSYPATYAKTYVSNLQNCYTWDVYVNWLDENENFASYLPDSSSNVNIYGSIYFVREAAYANQVSFHNSVEIAIPISCSTATFRDSSRACHGASWLNTGHNSVYANSFSGAVDVNFYDNSGCKNTFGPLNDDSNEIRSYLSFEIMGTNCNFYSTSSISNILNFLLNVTYSNTYPFQYGDGLPLFYSYSFHLPTASSGNVMISRLLGLPWFINI
jgi:hypothetical protein